MLPATPASGNQFADRRTGYVDPMGIVFGIIALGVILVIVGLAFTAVKWLLFVAAALFLVGILQAAINSRGGTTPGGPGAR